jgi:hypothetical protein
MKNIFEILHGTISFIALLGIVSLSALTVMAINPVQYEEENQGPNVAGLATTQIDTSNYIPIRIENTSIDEVDYRTNLEAIGDNEYIYKVNLGNAKAGEYKNKFVSIRNTNDFDIQIKVEPYLSYNIAESIEVRLLDHLDTFILNNNQYTNQAREITIPKNSSREINIQYLFTSDINFDSEITYHLGL